MAMETESLASFKRLVARLLERETSDPNEAVGYGDALISLIHNYAAGRIEWNDFLEGCAELLQERTDQTRPPDR